VAAGGRRVLVLWYGMEEVEMPIERRSRRYEKRSKDRERKSEIKRERVQERVREHVFLRYTGPRDTWTKCLLFSTYLVI